MTPIYTKDLSEGFFTALRRICVELQCDPMHLLGVMFSESGCYAKAKNPIADANGILQFMGDTLRNMGWSKGGESFRLLTAEAQLPFVLHYMTRFAGQLGSIAAIYTATFLPAYVPQSSDPDFVLVAKGGHLGWAYTPNAGFDANHDLKITVRELGEAVCRNCRGPRWNEIVQRATGRALDDPDHVEPLGFDLRTVRGIQLALSRLGFDVGPVDGVPGPLTQAGVLEFQHDHMLAADGVVGPATRQALQVAVETAG